MLITHLEAYGIFGIGWKNINGIPPAPEQSASLITLSQKHVYWSLFIHGRVMPSLSFTVIYNRTEYVGQRRKKRDGYA
jgi:hypothetical protein